MIPNLKFSYSKYKYNQFQTLNFVNMFKKRLSLGKESLLSSKDRKKLQSKVKGEYISKNSKYKQNSISGTRIKIISEEDQESWVPLFIDSDNFFPSVFFLWKNQEYLPIVFIWPPVSKFIINGADLMWPGVANQEQITQNLNAGALVSVAIVGNLPMAVGIISTARPQKDGKGKCVEILHHYMDELWMLHQHVPNDGFAITKVRPVQEFLKQEDVKQEEDKEEKEEKEKEELKVNDGNLGKELIGASVEAILSEDGQGLNIFGNEDKGQEDKYEGDLEGIKKDEMKLGSVSGEVSDVGGFLDGVVNKEGAEGEMQLGRKNEDDGRGELGEMTGDSGKVEVEEVKNEINQGGVADDQNAENIKNEDDENLPKLSHDQMILASFLTALYIGVQPNELPLEPSVLLGYMHRCKRSYTIDFSQSSYKKIGKFLQYVAKIKIIDYTKPIGSDHKLITSIDRSHNLLKDFVPIVKKMKNLNTEQEDSTPMPYPKIIFTSGFSPKFLQRRSSKPSSYNLPKIRS